MKTISFIFAVIISFMLAIGCFFKLQHYPGAAIMTGVGTMTFVFVYLPLVAVYFFNQKEREINNRNLFLTLPFILVIASPIMNYAAPKSFVDKFVILNEKIVSSNKSLESNNYEIYKFVLDRAENQLKDQSRTEKIKVIHQKTMELLRQITDIRNQVVIEVGGFDQNGRLEDERGVDKQMSLLLSRDGITLGEAYTMEKLVEQYIHEMKNIIPDANITAITWSGKENKLFQNDTSLGEKDYAHLNFEYAPNAACLAIINQVYADVLRIEQGLLLKIDETSAK